MKFVNMRFSQHFACQHEDNEPKLNAVMNFIYGSKFSLHKWKQVSDTNWIYISDSLDKWLQTKNYKWDVADPLILQLEEIDALELKMKFL